ncbi:uncharacterized protein LOC134780253 isoform X2 [Penaeus indicus]|uniref:uncharacterized protein LOC134780253 isoform X2 n=1 Tax=Penaeus indicus TaxID=29960 RepID=UPI00300C2EE7
MGRKKKITKDPEPYLIQHAPLNWEQLSTILVQDSDDSLKAVVTQVATPRAGQVYLVECAGARFARYDSHRWTAYYRHDGLGALLPQGEEDMYKDKIEVRYNKKRGNHDNLCNEAVRIVYKYKSPGDIVQGGRDISYHVVQYLEKLPDYVESKVKQDKEVQDTEMRELEEMAMKEKAVKQAEKETSSPQAASSSFGRKRKPNSRYTDLYKVEMTTTKSQHYNEEDTRTDFEDSEYEDELYGEMPGSPKITEVRKLIRGKRGRPPKVRVKGHGRHGGTTWMAGYGAEKTKPKSSTLFRMCEDDDDEDDEEVEEEEEEEEEEVVKEEEEEEEITDDSVSVSLQKVIDNEKEKEKRTQDIKGDEVDIDSGQIWYCVDFPSAAMKASIPLTLAQVTETFEKIIQGKMLVYTSQVLIAKSGDVFALADEVALSDTELWSMKSSFPQQNMPGLTVTWYDRTTMPQDCFDLQDKQPDVMLIYKSKKHAKFCMVHYLTLESSGLKSPVVLAGSDTPSSDSVLQLLDDPETISECFDDLKINALHASESLASTSAKNTQEPKLNTEKKGKSPGRPRHRGLTSEGELETKGKKVFREGQQEGRKREYADDEPQPFRIYTKGKLYHADADEIFKKVEAGEITVYKDEIKTPQYGDMYVLDKNFVPFSDSVPWVREYYYKAHNILMERFTLRDSKMVFTHPLPPAAKSVFTLVENEPQLCIVHYEKGNIGRGKIKQKSAKSEEAERNKKIYTESNSNLTLSLVAAMLSNPDEKRIVSAPILNPQPFQVYLLRLPSEDNTKVIDNYRWTDKGFKRWPLGVSNSETKLLCFHCPMKMARTAMCTALMRHEFKHTTASPDLRVVHYMPTREFREFIVISNAAKQLQMTSELAREGWENMELESEAPLYVSSSRLKPITVWDLLTRDAQHASLTGLVRMEIINPQPGGVYLSTKYEAPDLLVWEELGRIQIQPRLYQIVEVCEKISDAQPYLLRLCYTSPKVPHKVLVHYLGDTRPYLIKECEIVIDEYTGEPAYITKGLWKKGKRKAYLSSEYALVEEKLYRISSHHMRDVGCMPLKLEDLDITVKLDPHNLPDDKEELIAPDKPGLYLYGHRMMKKRIVRLLENLDRSRKTQIPIKNPEAGEAYLVTKPSGTKAAIDSYKWTQKGWQPIPRKDPLVLWRWGLLRHKKQTWAPPLIRIDYVHLKVNPDLMLVHYIPTKDNEMMLEIKSAIVPVRAQTHSLLSLGDVNFGQHSQLLTNSALPPSHIWELLNAGGGLSEPLTEPQPGGVYVINVGAKEKLDLFRWKTVGDIRLSSNDYGLMETSYLITWEPEGLFARLTYHTPLIKNRTVIHYLGDCRPYYDKAKAEEEERQKKLEYIRKKTGSSLDIDSVGGHDAHLSLSDIGPRDAATEAVGSILAGLGSNIMDTDNLNQTFAELGGEVEGLCEDQLSLLTSRPEDEHLRDCNLTPIEVPFGSISTSNIVKELFPQGLPKITIQKVLEVEPSEPLPKKRRLNNVIELPEPKTELKDDDKIVTGSFRAVPRSLEDWNEEEEEKDDCEEGEQLHRTRLQITTTEPRTIVYVRQQEILTEKQIDHMLCYPDISRISFLPLIDPQPGDVFVVAIPYRKGEVRRMDCYNWYVTGHKKGKYRRTYSYIKEEDGNISHRLLRYTYDYAWESMPGLRVIHYIPGDPRHQVQCVGKKPNFEEEPEGQGNGPLYRAYTAPMTHRDALAIINDPPMYHLCDLPVQDPKAGDVYIVKAPSMAITRREMMYDNMTWSEGHVKHVGGKRPVVRKIKYVSVDPSDGVKSDAFARVTWERLVDVTALDTEMPISRKKQAYIIIHYLGDETLAGEMVRKGKDGALHLRQIRHYIETGAYLASVHLTEKNGIRKSAKKFVIEDKMMYYVGKDGSEKRLVLYTNEEKNKAFEECHVLHKSGEHCGRTKTLHRLASKYYWTNMVEDIVAMIVRCKTCEFNKLNRPNQRYVRVTEPWEVVSIDIIGQFVTSDRGHVFVAVIIDMFTKYTVAVPLRDTTVADLTSAIQGIVFQQGPPRKFISDQNEDFIKELNQGLEMDVGLVGNVVAVSKTQINRPDEASIKTSILHHCLESASFWDDLLQRKVYEINTTYVTASGHTPFYLMFHRQVRPLDFNSSFQVNGNGKPTFVVRDIERYMEEREQKANDIINQVLTGQSSQSEHKICPEEVAATECVENITTTALLDAVHDGSHDHQTSVQVVTGTSGPDEDHAHYTHVAHLSEGQVIQDPGGSVYEMADGEGHVVVVADGMPGLEDGSEVPGQHMVVVQPGTGDQNVVMLTENQVIMETVDGQQFTYMPQT